MEHIKQYNLPIIIGFFNIGTVSFNAHMKKEEYHLIGDKLALTAADHAPNIAEDRSLYAHFSCGTEAVPLEGFWYFTLQSYRRYGTDLRISKEALLKYYSKNTRKSIRVAREKMTAYGTVTLDHYSNRDDILKAYDRIKRIFSQTYQDQFLNLELPSPDDLSKHPHTMELFILKVGEQDVAYLLCSSRHAHILSTEYTGYLPAYKNASPGTLMKWMILEKLIDDGHYVFIEYETGQNHHKMRFSNFSSPCQDHIYVRKNIGNMIKILPWCAVRMVDKMLNVMLEKLKLKKTLKQFFIHFTGK